MKHDIPSDARTLGADLRALRKARGMTLIALADALGKSVGWLSQVERDTQEVGYIVSGQLDLWIDDTLFHLSAESQPSGQKSPFAIVANAAGYRATIGLQPMPRSVLSPSPKTQVCAGTPRPIGPNAVFAAPAGQACFTA